MQATYYGLWQLTKWGNLDLQSWVFEWQRWWHAHGSREKKLFRELINRQKKPRNIVRNHTHLDAHSSCCLAFQRLQNIFIYRMIYHSRHHIHLLPQKGHHTWTQLDSPAHHWDVPSCRRRSSVKGRPHDLGRVKKKWKTQYRKWPLGPACAHTALRPRSQPFAPTHLIERFAFQIRHSRKQFFDTGKFVCCRQVSRKTNGLVSPAWSFHQKLCPGIQTALAGIVTPNYPSSVTSLSHTAFRGFVRKPSHLDWSAVLYCHRAIVPCDFGSNLEVVAATDVDYSNSPRKSWHAASTRS